MQTNATDSPAALPARPPCDRGLPWVVGLAVVILSGFHFWVFHGPIVAGAGHLVATLLLVLGVWGLTRRLLRPDAALWAPLALLLYLSLNMTSQQSLPHTAGLALAAWALLGHGLWVDKGLGAKQRLAALGLWGLSSLASVYCLGWGGVPLLLAHLCLLVSDFRRQAQPQVAALLVVSLVMLAAVVLKIFAPNSDFFANTAISASGVAESLRRLGLGMVHHPILLLGLLGALLRAIWARRPADRLTLSLLGWLFAWEILWPQSGNLTTQGGSMLMPLAALFAAEWLAAAWAWARSPFRHWAWQWAMALALGLLMYGYR